MHEWSPTASKIAFMSDRNGNRDIYLMNADGSELQNLTNTPHPEGRPEWSPDGSRIAFMSNREGNFNLGNFQVYVMNADGSGQARLTSYYDSVIDDLKWSPDGTQISFRRGKTGTDNEVYVIGVALNLTNNPASDLRGRWQPTGN